MPLSVLELGELRGSARESVSREVVNHGGGPLLGAGHSLAVCMGLACCWHVADMSGYSSRQVFMAGRWMQVANTWQIPCNAWHVSILHNTLCRHQGQEPWRTGTRQHQAEEGHEEGQLPSSSMKMPQSTQACREQE